MNVICYDSFHDEQPPEQAKPRIITTCVRPPIPLRAFDWSALRAGSEESGPMGWGRTEQLAIDDLLAQEEAQ